MIDKLILPLPPDASHEGYSRADDEYTTLVSLWLNSRIELIKEVWSATPSTWKKDVITDPLYLADEILGILTHRIFNFQSKINLSSLLPRVHQNLITQISKGTSIKLFLLYNGGYRASSFPENLSLIFEPDQTELMLLYQFALLNKRISAVYSPGIEVSIVINNGVAHYVNDIPLAATENYANRLRKLINVLGAYNRISVLLQSELVNYNPSLNFESDQSHPLLSEKEHLIVERFLGRTCSKEEARFRSALYRLAEEKWEEDLLPIVKANDVLMLRQVAHTEMLSFRPFPGGAIRTQNGSFGFQYQRNVLIPKLITSESVKKYSVKWVPYSFPWCINNNAVNTVGENDA